MHYNDWVRGLSNWPQDDLHVTYLDFLRCYRRHALLVSEQIGQASKDGLCSKGQTVTARETHFYRIIKARGIVGRSRKNSWNRNGNSIRGQLYVEYVLSRQRQGNWIKILTHSVYWFTGRQPMIHYRLHICKFFLLRTPCRWYRLSWCH